MNMIDVNFKRKNGKRYQKCGIAAGDRLGCFGFEFVLLVLSFVLAFVFHFTLFASTPQSVLLADKFNDENRQDYEAWSSPIKSYLEKTPSGYILVRSIRSGIVIYETDEEYHVINRRILENELPKWGGITKQNDCYYLVTGEDNKEESDQKEVIRVSKYDSSWNRLGSTSFSAINVYEPFAFGCLRMAFYEKYLFIQTGRTMYASGDGLHHQRSITLEVDTDAMTIVNSGNDYGWISHSLNQFIAVINNKIVSVQQGDAYPRGIILLESSNKLAYANDGECDVYTIMEVPGAVYEDKYQYLQASIGGFEVTPKNYLVSGNSVIQDENRMHRKTRNIMVLVVDRTTKRSVQKWITSYAEGSDGAGTPYMIRVGDNRFILLWSRKKEICCTMINEDGERVSDIYTHKGSLSDCVPILTAGRLVWFVSQGNQLDYYTMEVGNLNSVAVTHTLNGLRDISESGKVEIIPDQSYTGKEIKPEVIVKIDDSILKGDTDYKVSYRKNINVGTATVTVSGINNYTGSVKASFRITSHQGKNASVRLSKTYLTYNGKVQRPNLIVSVGGRKLSPSSYQAIWPRSVNPGEYTVAVKLKNGYKGAKKLKYMILPKESIIEKLIPGDNKLNLVWKKQTKQITGYEISYSTDSKFNDEKIVIVKGAKAIKKNIENLGSGELYYVRIRTYKMVGKRKVCSAWSKVKRMRTK